MRPLPPHTSLLLRLQFVQVLIQLVEPIGPDLPVLFDPVGNRLQLIEPGFANVLAPFSLDGYQAAFGKDPDMPRYRRTTYGKILCEAIERQPLIGQQRQNRPSVGIRNPLKDVPSHAGMNLISNA
jgi:hypothetical protein